MHDLLVACVLGVVVVVAGNLCLHHVAVVPIGVGLVQTALRGVEVRFECDAAAEQILVRAEHTFGNV